MAAYFFDDSGQLVVTNPTKQEAAARAREHVHHTPWLADLPDALEAGLSFVMLPQTKGSVPLLKSDFRWPFLAIIGDDIDIAHGPEGFHRATVRKLLENAVMVGIVPSKPNRVFYGRAIRTALETKRVVTLIETQGFQLGAWAKLAARHAKVPVEIDGGHTGQA